MTITPGEAAMEADWLRRGIGFETAPNGVVTAIGRANRDALLATIERRTP